MELIPKSWKAIYIGLGVISFTGIQYLARSYFGFGDRHILEVALLTIGLYFLIKAWNRENIYWAIASGVSFAIYQLTWSQTSLIVLLLVFAIVLYYIKEPVVSKKITIINIVFLLLQIPAGLWANYQQSIGISILGILAILFSAFVNFKFKSISKRLLVSILFMAGVLIFISMFFGDFLNKLMIIVFGFIGQKSDGPVVSEAQPMLAIYSEITLLPPTTTTTKTRWIRTGV